MSADKSWQHSEIITFISGDELQKPKPQHIFCIFAVRVINILTASKSFDEGSETLEVSRILVFTLAFKADAIEFIRNANKLLTDDEALTDDELTAYANILKSLRAESTKEENISTKGLLGGDKSAIIKIKIYIRKKPNRTVTYIHHS